MDPCPNKNCQVKALCWNLNDHLGECQFVKVKCPFCDKTISIYTIALSLQVYSKRDQTRQSISIKFACVGIGGSR
ncbi:hypothetical protein BC830DRAFT_1104200 [Chytriomyces sp. MP71]|nr:hypothetical protein BC830DRAFT_1104200 [Chytriomyces sp. MP71]